MLYKRYQYYSKDGIVWTNWFKCRYEENEKKQMGNKLLNEYTDESELTPEELAFSNPVLSQKKVRKTRKKATI